MDDLRQNRVNHGLDELELSRYHRQIILPEIGYEGQKKLKLARVLIVGVGGLGSPASLYLAAAGVGKIGLVDFDVVEKTNLHRQILFNESAVGERKIDAAGNRLKSLNPHITVMGYDTKLTAENAMGIIGDYDIVLDGTDNFYTRYLINDACVLLGKPNVFGSIFRFDGQVSVFNMNGGPCYRCLYPEPPGAGQIPSCAEAGVLGVLPGIIGSIQAVEAIKTITGVGETLSGRFLVISARTMRFSDFKIVRNEDCAVCGKKPVITSLDNYENHCAAPEDAAVVKSAEGFEEITVEELKERFDRNEIPVILDIREPYEVRFAPFPNAVHIATNELPGRLGELPEDKEIVVVCKLGVRSGMVCEYLKNHNFQHAKNLVGGVQAWTLHIDPAVPLY
ncbi:molybdopterin-synthase adenylyltransferase MoeB [candidate division KSB1 bacterium]